MEIHLATHLFLEYLLHEVKISDRVYRSYNRELERLATFLLDHGVQSFEDDRTISLFDEFFHSRTAHLSETYRNSIAYRFRRFFKFLDGQSIVKTDVAALVRYMARTTGPSPRKSLLQEIRELEKAIHELKRIDNTKNKFAEIKQEVIRVSKNLPQIERVLFGLCEEDVEKMKQSAQERIDSELDELVKVGTFLTHQDLSGLQAELSSLAKNIAKYGRESYKANTLFEAKQAKDNQFSLEIQRRLGRTERMIEGLLTLRTELEAGTSVQLLRNLLPVVDGLEEALAVIPDSIDTQPTSEKASKNRWKENSFLRKLFASIQPEPNLINIELKTWRDGLEMIRQRLLTVLANEGVRPINSIDEQFDPQYHIAVGVEHRDDVPEGTIHTERLKGYCRGDEVIRYAEVIVSKRD